MQRNCSQIAMHGRTDGQSDKIIAPLTHIKIR